MGVTHPHATGQARQQIWLSQRRCHGCPDSVPATSSSWNAGYPPLPTAARGLSQAGELFLKIFVKSSSQLAAQPGAEESRGSKAARWLLNGVKAPRTHSLCSATSWPLANCSWRHLSLSARLALQPGHPTPKVLCGKKGAQCSLHRCVLLAFSSCLFEAPVFAPSVFC